MYSAATPQGRKFFLKNNDVVLNRDDPVFFRSRQVYCNVKTTTIADFCTTIFFFYLTHLRLPACEKSYRSGNRNQHVELQVTFYGPPVTRYNSLTVTLLHTRKSRGRVVDTRRLGRFTPYSKWSERFKEHVTALWLLNRSRDVTKTKG